jgi:hypothetical protein
MFWFMWLAGGSSVAAAAFIVGAAQDYGASRAAWYVAPEPLRLAVVLVYPLAIAFLACPFLRVHTFMIAGLCTLGGLTLAMSGGLILRLATPSVIIIYRNVPIAMVALATGAACLGVAWWLGLQPRYD